MKELGYHEDGGTSSSIARMVQRSLSPVTCVRFDDGASRDPSLVP